MKGKKIAKIDVGMKLIYYCIACSLNPSIFSRILTSVQSVSMVISRPTYKNRTTRLLYSCELVNCAHHINKMMSRVGQHTIVIAYSPLSCNGESTAGGRGGCM